MRLNCKPSRRRLEEQTSHRSHIPSWTTCSGRDDCGSDRSRASPRFPRSLALDAKLFEQLVKRRAADAQIGCRRAYFSLMPLKRSGDEVALQGFAGFFKIQDRRWRRGLAQLQV